MWSVSSAIDQSFDIYLPVPSFVAAFEGFESISYKKFSCSDSFIYFLRMYVTKAIVSCDLRHFQYPFVCVTYFRIVGIIFHSATRHVLVESITRREDKSKDCRKIRIIEQVKRYG